ncbi:MAG: hypothetical protein JSS27_10045 [Planctomycetes bacterium]|nr:hypothetical protein [Planctomycetota bacterium]
MALRTKPFLIVVGVAAVALGAFARQPIAEWLAPPPVAQPVAVQLPPATPPAPSPQEIASPHLAWAATESERAVDEHLLALDRFFADAQRNTPAFAHEALGWGSKWRLVADYVPFTRGGRHEAFIRGKFEATVFKPEQVETAVRQVVDSYLRELKSIESTMLVRIRTDAADFPLAYPVSTFDRQRLDEIYAQAIAQAIGHARRDAASGASLEVMSIIVGEVLAQVAVELGVSAGVLGTGAALSWETFGIGLVVGIIVDAVISWVWDWYADPRGELAAKVNAKLDEVRRLIVDGSDQVQGLRSRLKQLAAERAGVREAAVLSLLQTQ